MACFQSLMADVYYMQLLTLFVTELHNKLQQPQSERYQCAWTQQTLDKTMSVTD